MLTSQLTQGRLLRLAGYEDLEVLIYAGEESKKQTFINKFIDITEKTKKAINQNCRHITQSSIEKYF